MEQTRQYEIIYTEAAAQDIEEKADYIAAQFCDSGLAENWYFRLKADLQEQLSTFPLKYPLYDVEPCVSISGPSAPKAETWQLT